MKVRITRKDLKREFVVYLPEAQNLLTRLVGIADYYNCGIYGWNWDAWKIEGIVFVDGYRSFPKCDFNIPYEIAQQWLDEVRSERFNRKELLDKIVLYVNAQRNK